MTDPARIAFYDFDGTLVSSNIVTRYAFFARRLSPRSRSFWKLLRLVSSVPAYILLDHVSRRTFNEVFFKEYRDIRKEWLEGQAEELFERVIRPSIFAGAKEMVEADRAQGFRLILVTGELDLVLGPAVKYFGFEGLVSNSLVFEHGVATGKVVHPLIAEDAKVKAVMGLSELHGADLRQAKAYSDSISDMPMLEAVGHPYAVNPDRRLRRAAKARGWPVRDLPKPGSAKAALERGNHVHIS